MDKININLELYTPRWGHTDTYTITFKKDIMLISMGGRVAKCEWQDNLDPKWSNEFGKNSLESILNNDSIYPPQILINMLEQVWKSWRDEEIDQEQVSSALQDLTDWLNIITENKPKTDFWLKYF